MAAPPHQGQFAATPGAAPLTTDRMLLRPLTSADADALVELDGDPQVMRYLTGGVPTPRERVVDEVLPRLLEEHRRFPGLGRRAAEDLATGAFLGWFALRPPQDGDGTEVELGYRLRRAAWGRGLATEGCRALLRLAFVELGVQRVFAETMAVNHASRRVLEKAGLRLVRTFHVDWDDPIDGSEHGEVAYELRRSSWCGV